ncbi:hypothetical protein CANCADRAFT_116281 [Tortispora caseinolytica NRRL Y-17796]|uniref:SHSP domain-containing protein n=1 Tax=Tortispora caseinolytica NRRL Y-17796 TaxID=767744 RepID=A0A1E4TH60_9ASCO|nr:hypothetical protein CANCADRAFT_116281 [Tortispora caseinolytica NRRL Y-17796]
MIVTTPFFGFPLDNTDSSDCSYGTCSIAGIKRYTNEKPINDAESPVIAPLDVYETEDNFTVVLDFPGVNPDSIKAEFDASDNSITVTGSGPSAPDSVQYRVRERETGDRKRVVKFPRHVRLVSEKISAQYSYGVLELTIPKEGPQTRRIPIAVNGSPTVVESNESQQQSNTETGATRDRSPTIENAPESGDAEWLDVSKN